ncbi:MAG: YcgL domain-containing protein [Dokdonella sp.]|uniref:YcgL domain-containing protein n=1 Tax=Dokdonella sp. TaxID=2291710 RepID=UPI003F7E9E1A
MRCFVYKSLRKAETYVYLRKQDGGTELPAALRDSLDPLQHVLELDLTPTRRLAQADAARVIEALELQGYYLQFPPNPLVTEAGSA